MVVIDSDVLEKYRRQLDDFENVAKEQTNLLDETIKSLAEANNNYAEAVTTLNYYEQNCVRLNEELMVNKSLLAEANEKNRNLFKALLGFSKDDFILLNKSLWGQEIGIAEFDNE